MSSLARCGNKRYRLDDPPDAHLSAEYHHTKPNEVPAACPSLLLFEFLLITTQLSTDM